MTTTYVRTAKGSKEISALVAFALLAIPLLMTQSAFASNPYIGAYRDSSTIHHPNSFYGYVDFTGTISVTSYTGPVVSMAGWGSTTPTSMSYQSPTFVDEFAAITGDPHVWQVGFSTPRFYRDIALGHFGSASTDVSYVYQVLVEKRLIV